jgi:chromosome segregation ATPase
LEERVTKLIEAVETLRTENTELRSSIEDKDRRLQEIETERQNLNTSIGSLKDGVEDRERKLHTATEKLEGIIRRLESVG